MPWDLLNILYIGQVHENNYTEKQSDDNYSNWWMNIGKPTYTRVIKPFSPFSLLFVRWIIKDDTTALNSFNDMPWFLI